MLSPGRRHDRWFVTPTWTWLRDMPSLSALFWFRTKSGTLEFRGVRQRRHRDDGPALSIIASQQALRHNLKPNDVGGTIVYPMSDASIFVTAQTPDGRRGTIATWSGRRPRQVRGRILSPTIALYWDGRPA